MSKAAPNRTLSQTSKYAGFELERGIARMAENALRECDGNRTHAAAFLGISVRTMRNWIKRFNLETKFPAISRRPDKTS